MIQVFKVFSPGLARSLRRIEGLSFTHHGKMIFKDAFCWHVEARFWMIFEAHLWLIAIFFRIFPYSSKRSRPSDCWRSFLSTKWWVIWFLYVGNHNDFFLSICLSSYLFSPVCLFVWLFVCLSAYLPIYHLSISPYQILVLIILILIRILSLILILIYLYLYLSI